MSVAVLVRDEQVSGTLDRSFVLQFPTERITVRELIRERIYQEVDDHNRLRRELFLGLVRPEYQEGHPQKKARVHQPIDWKKQFDSAVIAYEHRSILVLVDQRQTTSLEEVVVLKHDSEVTFIRLVMLVGG